MPFVLAAISRDKKTIPTSLKETLWVPTPWDKGLKAPPARTSSVLTTTAFETKALTEAATPTGPNTSLFTFRDPAIPVAWRHSPLFAGHSSLSTLLHASPSRLFFRTFFVELLTLPISMGTAPLLRWSRFLEGQGEVGTPRLHSLKDGERQQNNHVQLPTPNPLCSQSPSGYGKTKEARSLHLVGHREGGAGRERVCLSKGKQGLCQHQAQPTHYMCDSVHR